SNSLFKVLSSDTRRRILKLLTKREMHISGLANELGISVPVTAKHCKLLEDNGLIERRKFGRTHVLRANMDKFRFESLYDDIDIFAVTHEVELPKGSNVLDALRRVSGVEIKRVGDKEFVTSVDGEEGYYIFEVDGKLPNKSMDEFVLKGNVDLKLKKLVPVKKKEINIRVR
ncbi:MAG: metalloregulator ArsR/SmtB family transcription factor, partial [Candidatus Hydrothermarchaeaceae archaeon]